MMTAFSFLLALSMVQAGGQAPTEPPAIRAAFTRDSVRVGDLVGVAVQVDLPAGSSISAPDTLDLGGDIENAAPRRLEVDTLADGSLRHRLIYPITAWRPGPLTLPALSLTLRAGQGERVVTIALPSLAVLTVLPADTANVQPKPPRDVWGASRLWWPLVLAAVVLWLILGVLIWWWRRRPRKPAAAEQPAVPLLLPREWALREIDRLVAAHLIERGDYQRFYIELSGILRVFLERTEHDWSSDLTTRELADRLYAMRADARVPIDVLSRADLVKFARQQHGAEQAARDIADSRRWVDAFVRPAVIMAEAA